MPLWYDNASLREISSKIKDNVLAVLWAKSDFSGLKKDRDNTWACLTSRHEGWGICLPFFLSDKKALLLRDVKDSYSQLILVSDNPSFDIGWINLYLSIYTNRLPLNYSYRNKYRMIWDTHSMQKSLLLLKGDFNSEWDLPNKLNFKTKWVYNHNPLNDARTIADFFNQTIGCLKILKR